MEFSELRVFLRVAAERSFSRAAMKLHRTQPAVSQSVRRLEDSVGERLFDRATKDATLTEAGRVEWDGTSPLHFEEGKRYLVVVGPLFRGDFAVVDTDRWVLEPRRVEPRKAVT